MKIDLLSSQEAVNLPPKILLCTTPKNEIDIFNRENNHVTWWISSEREYCSSEKPKSAVISPYGLIDVCGYNVKTIGIAVRPVLRLTEKEFKQLPPPNKKYIKYLNSKWVDLSEYLGEPVLLKKNSLKYPIPFDFKGISSDYNQSSLKSFLEKWLEKRITGGYNDSKRRCN